MSFFRQCYAEDVDIILHATSFEEFLVRVYFSQWTNYVVNAYELECEELDKNIPDNVKEYLIRVYTKQGRTSMD
jgi:hypothetical protein